MGESHRYANMRTFMEWLVLEFGTVAQQLKTANHPNLQSLRDAVRNELQRYEGFKKIGRDADVLVNFLTKKVLDSGHPDARSASPRDPSWMVSNIVRPAMNKWGDFIFATWQHTRSKLNSPAYTDQQLQTDSDRWHEDIGAKKSTMPSEEYEVFLELHGAWEGWKWVSLGRGYCPAEAKAMGHCGNSGAREGDDILSLRDPEGKAHLTFILNDGMLGEMKGRANNKPSPRYHQAIVELLKHPGIHSLRGGGYAPEKNFSLKDLPENERKQIESMKPEMGNPIMHMLKSGKKRELATELGVEPDDISLQGNEVVLAKFNEFDELGEIVSGSAFEWWFGDDRDRHDGGGWDAHWRDIEDYVDQELDDLMVKVAKEEEYEVEDAGEAFDESDTVRSAVEGAFHDAYQAGAESEAWDRFKSLMGSPDDEHGFWVDMDHHPYRLMISIEGLNRMGRLDDQEYRDLKDMIKSKELFKFEEPYNGFSGFDEQGFLENAKDMLKAELERAK